MSENSNWKKYWVVYLLFLLPGISGLLFGYSISAATGALGSRDPKQGFPQLIQTLNLSEQFEQWFTSMTMFGALLGSAIVFIVGDILGRKGTLMTSNLMYAIGASIIVFAPFRVGSNLTLVILLMGQLIYGIGVGFAMHSAPLYIAETAPAEIRGFLVTLKEEAIVGGILLGYLAGFIFENTLNGWRYLFILPIILSVCALIGFLFAPESPRLLILKKFRSGSVNSDFNLSAFKALKSLRPTFSDIEIESELLEIERSLETINTRASSKDLLKKGNLPALILGISMVFFQQATGQPSVLAYSPQIFRFAGYKSRALLAAVAVGVVKFIATGVAVVPTDRFGRKPLLLIGTTGMAVALTILAISFGISPHDSDLEYSFSPAWSIITLISLMMYVSFYQVGYGPIVWLLQSEIFPLNVRGQAQSIAVLVNFGLNAVISFSFLTIFKGLTPTGAFSLYAVLCIVSNAVVIFFLPETKGKTLEEIQRIFSKYSNRNDPFEQEEQETLLKGRV